jgi:hypothetical protein
MLDVDGADGGGLPAVALGTVRLGTRAATSTKTMAVAGCLMATIIVP